MTTKKIVLIVGGVVVVLAFLVICFAGGIIGIALYQIGNSEAAARAKDFLRTSEKLKTETGSIKDFGSIVTGSINLQNGSGDATLHLKVIGDRKIVNATVDLILVKGSTWRVSSASYVNEAGQTIGLLDPYDTKTLIPRLIGLCAKSPIGFLLCATAGSSVPLWLRNCSIQRPQRHSGHRGCTEKIRLFVQSPLIA